MDKLIFRAAWMAAAVLIFAWSVPAAAAPEAGMHVSNRVKIERPGISAPLEADVKKEEPTVARPEPVLTKPQVTDAEEAVKSERPAEPIEEPAEDAATLVVEDPLASQMPGRFYSRAGRMDPFDPFLYKPEPEVTPTEQEQLQIRAPQTPLERMDLAQVRLTAIMRAPGKTRALVEEASGKGYVINEGTYIGNKGGRVSKILPDRVIVEEKYLDIYGKIATRERELKLQN
jgi:type IV pilus assembly protein PilP